MMPSERPVAFPRFPIPYTKRLVWRTVLLWFAVRLVVLVFAALDRAGNGNGVSALLDGPLIAGSARIALVTTAVVVALAAIDLHATRENILIANLGLSPARALLMVASVAFALEIVVLVATML